MDPRRSETSVKRLYRSDSGLSLKSLTISIVPSESESIQCHAIPTASAYGYKFGTVKCCNNHDTIPRHRKHHHSTHDAVIRDEYYSGSVRGVMGKKKKGKKHPLLLSLLNADLAPPSPSANRKIKSSGKAAQVEVKLGSYSCDTARRISPAMDDLEETTRVLEQAMLSTKVLLERACKELSASNKSSGGSWRVASPVEAQPSPPNTPPNEEEQPGESLPESHKTLGFGAGKVPFMLGLEQPIQDMDDVRLLSEANLRLMRGLQREYDGLKQLREKMGQDNRTLEKLLHEAEADKALAESLGAGKTENAFIRSGSERRSWDAFAQQPAPEARHKRRSTVGVLPFFKSFDEQKPKRRFSASPLIGWNKVQQAPPSLDELQRATMHLPKLERYPCIRRG